MDDFNDLNSAEPLLPSIIGLEGITDPATKKFALAVKEILEVRLGTRPRASGLDKGLTLRDLYRYNIGSFVVDGQTVTNPNPDTGFIATGSNIVQTPVVEVIPPDLTPPGAPLGFLATGTKLAVLLEWNAPATSVAYTELYRASVDNIGVSVLIGTTEATIDADIIGSTDITNYYWIRFVSVNDVRGPYNAIAGTVATTGRLGSNDLISVDGAKIIDATILNAKIANVSADKITTGTIAVGQALQVGLAANRIFVDGNGIIRSGGMLDYLNGSGFYLNAQGGTARLSIGNATNYIGFNGTNISIDTPNFKILGDQLTFNGSGTFAGNLTAVNGTLANLRINAGGMINSGGFTGFAWPPAGQSGFHLGTNGLLLGNFNNNRYVQFSQGGEFYMGNGTTNMVSDASGFVINGPLVATGNILNNAITITSTVYTAASIDLAATNIQVQSLVITTTGNKVLILASFDAISSISGFGDANGNIFFELLVDGVILSTTTGAAIYKYSNNGLQNYSVQGGGAVAFNFSHTPSSGTHTYSVNSKKTNDSRFIGSVSQRSLFAMEIKR